ncbi:dethiobiotin synthetase [Caloranaerobacter azorensis DSM 13643]|uniref:ATP-dependent dethiobiotin synthetase BioD n=1 Tax=Caloranaerobacter azorensis DSM 13643 TaxID=1121264 RepID=A0A1M5SS53_9FIRM|nr:dethiobiotin synthase [Caloranaerobacter azorensis]SHH41312.1 dethiobiotin synthetase [Caloranaerobacter azorensis DSM 13643]
MSRGLFVIGTDTDVGKSVVTAGLVYILRKNGINACSFKAVQSGGIIENNRLVSGDTMLVKKVCNLEEDEHLMNPYCLSMPVSPHLAAKIERIEINKRKILDTYRKLSQKYEYIIAEGSGGIVVPIIENKYFIYDLIKDLSLPIIIVSRADVGTINHTVLTVRFAESIGLDIKGIIINRYTGKIHEKDNIETIKNITKKEILAVIDEIEDFDYNSNNFKSLKSEFEKKIDADRILNLFKEKGY